MELHVSLDGPGGLTVQIYRSLLDGVLDGRLQPGDRLPPTRDLAASLGVSRNTVATAYERLTAEGFLSGRIGAGTFVVRGVPGVRQSETQRAADLQPRPGWTHQPSPVSSQHDAPEFDFRVGLPDAHLFPFDTWRRLVTQELRLTANDPGTYGDPSGHPALRAAIARYVGYARSVRATPDDLVVTSGAQQAIDLVARVLVEPGDVVAVEEPGYPQVRALFASHGARVIGVPVDGEGLAVDRLPPQVRVVYTTPSHQFPLGTAMSLPRRVALIEWAQTHGAAVVEDDYDSEFRFADRPLDPLHTIDSSGRVLYVGTFSKTLLPSLRLGFVVAPPTLQRALAAARQLSDGFGPLVTQAALARFMDEGQLARHIRRASRVYAARRSAVIEAVEGPLAEWLELLPSAAGLHVCVRLRSGGAGLADAVVAAADLRGVAVDALGGYCHDAPQAGLVIGYGATRSGAVREGMAVLGSILRREATRRTTAS